MVDVLESLSNMFPPALVPPMQWYLWSRTKSLSLAIWLDCLEYGSLSFVGELLAL